MSVYDKYLDIEGQFYPGHPTGNCCIVCERICIITLAKFHPILQKQKKIKSINFDAGSVNRLDNKVSGKGKRGAQWLGVQSKLCLITCEDGEQFTINCGIRSQLIEVNENLLDNPNLLVNKPQSDGFIAIVLPKLNEYDQVIKKLKSEDEYMKLHSKYAKTSS